MSTVIAQNRQSVFDLAIQAHGAIEAALQFASLNNLSVTGDVVSGSLLAVGDVLNPKVQSFFAQKNISPASSVTNDDVAQTIGKQGIDYWAIEVDFIVS